MKSRIQNRRVEIIIFWQFCSLVGGTLVALTVLAAAVLMHEFGHAVTGFYIGGVARPRGFGWGVLSCCRSWGYSDGRWRREEFHPFPHIKFQDELDNHLTHLRMVAAGGPLLSLSLGLALSALLYTMTGHPPWDGLGLGLQALVGWRFDDGSLLFRGQLYQPLQAGWMAITLLFASANLFFFLNIIPFRFGSHGSDGWHVFGLSSNR
jgi:hypothetical protein